MLLRILHACDLIHLLQNNVDRVVGIHLVSSFLAHLLCDQGSIFLSPVTAFVTCMHTNFGLWLLLLLLDCSGFLLALEIILEGS